jgi:hypothetical protein
MANRDTERGYPAEKARQGESILRSKLQRFIFIAGLAGIVVFAFLVAIVIAA